MPLARRAAIAATCATLAAVALAAMPDPARDDRDAIAKRVDALYAVISGPAGEPRDWDAMRAMFTPSGRLTAMVREVDSGKPREYQMSVDEYIETSGPMLTERGFTEHEIASRTEVFGTIAHVWTTYEGFIEGREEPLVRGINSIQLVKLDGEWMISTVLWDAERPEQPLPPEYLPEG